MMRIAAALILAIASPARHTPRPPPRRDAFIAVAGEGHVNVAPDYRGILRRRRGPRREPGGRHATAQRSSRKSHARRCARSRSTMSTSSDRRSAWSRCAAAARSAEKKQASPEYRATTTFSLQSQSAHRAQRRHLVHRRRRRVRGDGPSATASRTRSAPSTTRAARPYGTPAGRPRSMPMPPGQACGDSGNLRRRGAEPRFRSVAARGNTQCPGFAARHHPVPRRHQHQMADRRAALKARRNIATHSSGSDIVTRFESHAPWHDA